MRAKPSLLGLVLLQNSFQRDPLLNPWLICVNVWQKPLQYCKVISLQLIKINGNKMRSLKPYPNMLVPCFLDYQTAELFKIKLCSSLAAQYGIFIAAQMDWDTLLLTILLIFAISLMIFHVWHYSFVSSLYLCLTC